LDSIDARIFCEIAFQELSYKTFVERHVSPAEIGKKLDLDEKTVRIRVRRMENSGFIKYYQVHPNIALFGFRSITSYRFKAPNLATKFVIVENIHQIPGLIEGLDYLGPFLLIEIAGKSSSEAEETAKALANRYELDLKNLGSRVVKEPLLKLDCLDWEVIQELRYNAQMTIKEIAAAASATPRIVGYRIAKLLGSGAVSIRAVIDAQKQEGLIFYDLEIVVEEAKQGAVTNSLRNKFGERIWSMKNKSASVIIASLFGFTLGDPENSVRETIRINGVRRCSLFVLKEIVEPKRSNWLDLLIERQISSQPVRTISPSEELAC